jgi:hypothetical protein
MNFQSVTQVISPWVDWSKIPPGVLQYAGERGTLVHDLCVKISYSQFVIVPPDCEVYVNNFRRWYDSNVEEVLMCEERLYESAFLFDGKPDFVVKLKEGIIALVDLKTPLLKSKSWRLQLAAYKHLCINAGYKIDRAGSLQLAGPSAKMIWYEENSRDFTVFLSALNVNRFFDS